MVDRVSLSLTKPVRVAGSSPALGTNTGVTALAAVVGNRLGLGDTRERKHVFDVFTRHTQASGISFPTTAILKGVQ